MTKSKLDLDSENFTNLQLPLYMFLFHSKYGEIVSDIQFWHINQDKIDIRSLSYLFGDSPDEFLSAFSTKLKGILDEIFDEKRPFYIKEGSYCRYCDYSEICRHILGDK